MTFTNCGTLHLSGNDTDLHKLYLYDILHTCVVLCMLSATKFLPKV